jgi:TrpR-related protein YerC/YecD
MVKKYSPQGKLEKQLINSFLRQKDRHQMANFLRDLLTSKEMREFAHRLEVARLLLRGKSYLDIATSMKVSTTTVTRVAHWLNEGHGGYKRGLSQVR